MKKYAHLLGGFLLSILGVLTIASPATSVSAQTIPSLWLMNQTFNVTSESQLRFVFNNDIPIISNTVEVELHRRVVSRRSFQSIASGDVQSGVLDALTLMPTQIRKIKNTIQVVVPITQRSDSARSLYAAFDGVYPVTIRIRDKDTQKATAEVLTFINVRRTVDTTHDVQTSALVRLKAAPSLQPNGRITISDETRARVKRFIEVLQNHTYAMTVAVQPEIIEALATSKDETDKQLFIALREQLRQRTITTAPFLPTDPSMFVSMNMREGFIEQLRVGEDALNKWLPGVAIQRSTYIADHYLTSEGLQLLRTAGIVSVILTPRAQQKISVSRTSNVVMRPRGINSNNVTLLAVDAALASTIANNAEESSPALAGFRAAAELLVARSDLLESGHDINSIRLLLSTPSGDISSDSSLLIATNALSKASGIRFVDMSAPQIASADSSSVSFSSTTPNTGAARAAGIAVARTELTATASMADPSDPRRELWAHLFAMGVSNTVINGDDYIAGLRDLLAKVRGSVTVTTPGTITLSGRSGAIRIQIRNNSDVPLSVRVRLASAKLSLQNPVRVVDLAAGGTTEVKVDAGTRTNGRFPISIRVTTPQGNLEVVPYIRVTARMNAIAGFGQYLSLFLLLMVLLWWWTHWRRTRSQRARGTTVSD